MVVTFPQLRGPNGNRRLSQESGSKARSTQGAEGVEGRRQEIHVLRNLGPLRAKSLRQGLGLSLHRR